MDYDRLIEDLDYLSRYLFMYDKGGDERSEICSRAAAAVKRLREYEKNNVKQKE